VPLAIAQPQRFTAPANGVHAICVINGMPPSVIPVTSPSTQVRPSCRLDG
jgi:hypothetical protein